MSDWNGRAEVARRFRQDPAGTELSGVAFRRDCGMRILRRSVVCEEERRKMEREGELCVRETVKSKIVARQPAEPRDRIGSMERRCRKEGGDVLLSIRLRRF